MTIIVILNGISRKKKKFYDEIYPALRQQFDVEVRETQHASHAEELAADAVEHSADVVLAAGGDGTLHQVINGVLRNTAKQLPAVGVIPLGSGNDFARTCSIRRDATQLIQLIQSGAKSTDVGQIICPNAQGTRVKRYFINVCSVGLGPAVVMSMSKKRAWGPDLAYLTSIVSTFFTHQPQEIECKASGWEWKGKARVVAIANGRAFGNGIFIAPEAQLNDGSFNSFIAGDLPLWKFLIYLQEIKSGKKIQDDMIRYNMIHSATLSSAAGCALETDGEIEGQLPAEISLCEKTIRFIR